MLLTGNEIEKQRSEGRITIEPYFEDNINPNSYNVHLASELLRYKNSELDAAKDNPTRTITIPNEGLWLSPGVLYLGSTVEVVGSNHFVPMLNGRSSVGRLGLFVHVTAGFGDVGFLGKWTLELTCVHPVKVYAGMGIAQICFHRYEGNTEGRLYIGKYQGQAKPVSSRMNQEF